MKRTVLTAYFQGCGITDEIKTTINLIPFEAAKYYLNFINIRVEYTGDGNQIEFKMKCTHVRTDKVQEWDGKEWKDITDKESFAVGTWKKIGNEFIHIAPYNNSGKATRFNKNLN